MNPSPEVSAYWDLVLSGYRSIREGDHCMDLTGGSEYKFLSFFVPVSITHERSFLLPNGTAGDARRLATEVLLAWGERGLGINPEWLAQFDEADKTTPEGLP